MLRIKILFPFLILFIFWLPCSWGATYYFSDSSGSDTGNNCTNINSPCQTIAKANSVMSGLSNGQHSILFNRGDTWTIPSGGATALIISVSGTSDSARVDVGAYGVGNKPIINGGNADDWHGSVYTEAESWITIENLEITNGNKQALGINQESGSTGQGYIVQDCVIHDNVTDGFSIVVIFNHTTEGNTTNFIFRRNTIYNSKWNGLTINGGVTDFHVYSNTIYGSAHFGMQSVSMGSINNNNFEIYSNDLYRNGSYSDGGGGIYIVGSDNGLIYGNTVHDDNTATNLAGIKADRNTGSFPQHNDSTNLTIRNNVVWNLHATDSSVYGIWVTWAVSPNIWNNTIYGCDSTVNFSGSTGVSNQNNLTFANISDNASLRNFPSDPKFIAPTATPPDFHLQSSSPVIDKGTDVGLPYSGTAPDLGAYEYNAAGTKIKAPSGLRIVLN